MLEEKRMDKGQLYEMAAEARKKAYAPYSHFKVGAALLTAGGKVYTGCNIENAAFTPGNCAERTAFFKAVSEGERKFSAIAVCGGAENAESLDYCTPCGVCRQVMREFCDPENFEIIVGRTPRDTKAFKLKELLPMGFGPENLAK